MTRKALLCNVYNPADDSSWMRARHACLCVGLFPSALLLTWLFHAGEPICPVVGKISLWIPEQFGTGAGKLQQTIEPLPGFSQPFGGIGRVGNGIVPAE
jgi:hypothetical protein